MSNGLDGGRHGLWSDEQNESSAIAAPALLIAGYCETFLIGLH
jgi:hypothetical protein